MSYIGNNPVTAHFPTDAFNGDDATTVFNLSQSPGTASAIDIHIGSVYQIPDVAYTISGSVLTFTSAPPTGTNNIFVVHKGTQVLIPTPADGSVRQSMVDTSSITPIAQSIRTDNGSYSSSTATIPFDNTPPLNTDGFEFMTVAITPRSATNRLVIEAQMHCSSGSPDTKSMCLFKDSDSEAMRVAAGYNGANEMINVQLSHEMIAGTTNQIIFKIRVGNTIGTTVYMNSNTNAARYAGLINSYVKVTEVVA